jgi:hypothetical protein
LGHHDGVENGATVGDDVDRVDEPGDIGNAVLEQVADPTAAIGDQFAGVELLDVLGTGSVPADRVSGPAPRSRP